MSDWHSFKEETDWVDDVLDTFIARIPAFLAITIAYIGGGFALLCFTQEVITQK